MRRQPGQGSTKAFGIFAPGPTLVQGEPQSGHGREADEVVGVDLTPGSAGDAQWVRLPPPGWYADPEGRSLWRWWDGTNWVPRPGWYTNGESAPWVRDWNGAQRTQKRRKPAFRLSIASLVLAVLGIMLAWLTPAALLVECAALVCGLLSFGRPSSGGKDRALAIAAIAIAVLWVVMIILIVLGFLWVLGHAQL